MLLGDLGSDLVTMARLVQSQFRAGLTAFFQRDVRLARRVTERDDQVDNLLGLIEDTCFRQLADGARADDGGLRQLRGAFRVALNLEKLGDYAVDIAEQAIYVSPLPPRALPFDLAESARIAQVALDEVIESFIGRDADLARQACRCEVDLDQRYGDALAEALGQLRAPHADPPFIVANLSVAKLLEHVGDSILNIGESTLFLLTGERLKLHQYLHLREMAATVVPEPVAPSLDVRPIWGGSSGARLGRVAIGDGGPLLWKEGAERKIEDELREVAEWNRVVPGLVPDVKARYQRDGRESFLGQLLDGALLRDVYLTHPWDQKVAATRRLLESVRQIWVATSAAEVPGLDYVRQIEDRLADLYSIHPRLAHLRRTETRVFGIPHRSVDELLAAAARRETGLAPPLSVRIHGDFNTNNVIYDGPNDRVHFIDVHRSGPGDYVQDVGVFLVSNLRHPIQDEALVAQLGRLNGMVIDCAGEFARSIGDMHFAARLALSQARSFITSARLVTDVAFARRLFLRGLRLLESVARPAA
jgi:phosphate uptake regulator